MGFITVDEPFAVKPRRADPKPTSRFTERFEVDGYDGIAEVGSVDLARLTLDLGEAHRLDISDSRLTAVSLRAADADMEAQISGSVVEQSDLSRLRIRTARQSVFRGVKLVGTDFSDGVIQDCEFDECVLRLTNLRMATLRRVIFNDCTIEDMDAYSAQFEDVSFPGSRVESLNIDRVTSTRTDLRECEPLGLTGFNRLDGFLVSEQQLPALSYRLAASIGLSIEAP